MVIECCGRYKITICVTNLSTFSLWGLGNLKRRKGCEPTHSYSIAFHVSNKTDSSQFKKKGKTDNA